MNEKKPKQQTFIERVAWTFVILGFVAAAIGLVIVIREPNGFSLNNLGSFGSYAQGTVASLWSLAALFFIYATLQEQRRQIKQQEEQLELQRQQFQAEQQQQLEDNKQREKQFKEQHAIIQLQNFETSFYQLLNQLRQATSELRDHTERTTEGRDCFQKWHSQLKSFYDSKWSHKRMMDIYKKLEEQASFNERLFMISIFQEFYDERQDKFGHYFRLLYHTVKLVESAAVLDTHEKKKRYTSLVRAQLSAYELILLYYNGLLPEADKFRPWLTEYNFFKHLDVDLLVPKGHEDYYDPPVIKQRQKAPPHGGAKFIIA